MDDSSKPLGRKSLRPPCDQRYEDDGIDPRVYFRSASPRGQRDRKTRMLCSQVRELLHLHLGWESRDPELEDLEVGEVRPAPDASRLEVEILVPAGRELAPIEAALQRAAGRIRCAVAGAIRRKRAPELSFRLHPEEAS